MKKHNHVKTQGYQGAAFGVMEGIVMMLGVLIGLSVTGNKSIAILGVVTAGVADAFANSSAFYVSEESEGIHTRKEIWRSTMWTLIGTVASVVVLLIPLLLLDIPLAAYVGFVVALIMLTFLGFFVAKWQKMNVGMIILKYIMIGFAVSIATFVVSELLLKVLVI